MCAGSYWSFPFFLLSAALRNLQIHFLLRNSVRNIWAPGTLSRQLVYIDQVTCQYIFFFNQKAGRQDFPLMIDWPSINQDIKVD